MAFNPDPLATGQTKVPPPPGSAGSNWRMAKLRRVFETATEEKRSVEDVAVERYGSLDAFEEARLERRILDARQERGQFPGQGSLDGRKAHDPDATTSGLDEFGRELRPPESSSAPRYLYTNSISSEPGSASSSRPPSRSGFRRPGEAREQAESTPISVVPRSKPGTPVPSVFTPPSVIRKPSTLAQPPMTASSSESVINGVISSQPSLSKPPLSPTSLNRLQAKVLKAKLLGTDEADELEQTYEMEMRRAQQGDAGGGHFSATGADHEGGSVQVLPTLDGFGRLYDVGTAAPTEGARAEPANKKRRRKEPHVDTHDVKTGERLRYVDGAWL